MATVCCGWERRGSRSLARKRMKDERENKTVPRVK